MSLIYKLVNDIQFSSKELSREPSKKIMNPYVLNVLVKDVMIVTGKTSFLLPLNPYWYISSSDN